MAVLVPAFIEPVSTFYFVNYHLDNPGMLIKGNFFGPHVHEAQRQLPPEPRVDKTRGYQYSSTAKR